MAEESAEMTLVGETKHFGYLLYALCVVAEEKFRRSHSADSAF